MRPLIILFLIMASSSTLAQNGKATTEKKTFSRTTTISQMIAADLGSIWALLTDAKNFANWNSTVVSLSGSIREGEKIRLVSSLDPNRTFKLKIKEMIPEQKLVWGDALGKRTYTLEAQGTHTRFTMQERIGGIMFPLFANKIPPFDESFEQFTADLKQAAESRTQAN